MIARLKPPYQYVIDSSALFDLRRQYPRRVFGGLWERFEEMCDNQQIVAPYEVLREIKNGQDELYEWSKERDNIFLEPCEEEYSIVQEIVSKYNCGEKLYSTKPWADPFVISCAKYYGLPIIQHELLEGNRVKIPLIAKAYKLNCLTLVKLFDEENWFFS